MSLFFMIVLLISTAGCSNQEVVDLSDSNLANSLYNQHSPGQQKQYYFKENALSITAGDTLKPEMFEDDNYKKEISEKYENIQVIETKKKFILTGNDDFKMELSKNSDGLLVNEEGEEFIKAN